MLLTLLSSIVFMPWIVLFFFCRYFNEKAKTSSKKPDDLESLSDDEFEDYLESIPVANFADEIKGLIFSFWNDISES